MLCLSQAYEPFIAQVEVDFENDLMPLFKKTLRLGGFKLDGKSGIWRPSTCKEPIVRVFGPNASRGHFNGLVQFQGFKAGMVQQHELYEDGQMWDPTACAGSAVYSAAVAELGNGAFGSDSKLKPAWLLRKLMVNKWIEGDGEGMPDWRVRGIAAVDTDRLFEVETKTIRSWLDGAEAEGICHVTIRFTWQGCHRKKPGMTFPRVVFTSLV